MGPDARHLSPAACPPGEAGQPATVGGRTDGAPGPGSRGWGGMPSGGCWGVVWLLLFGSMLVESRPLAANMNQFNVLGCIWRSSISPTMPREQRFSPRPECRFGQLWWYDVHPGYVLRVYFRHETPSTDFRLCLQYHEKGYVELIHQQTGDVDTLLKPPKPGSETCVTSQKGLLEMYFEAPSFDFYVTVIEYVIRDAEPP